MPTNTLKIDFDRPEITKSTAGQMPASQILRRHGRVQLTPMEGPIVGTLVEAYEMACLRQRNRFPAMRQLWQKAVEHVQSRPLLGGAFEESQPASLNVGAPVSMAV